MSAEKIQRMPGKFLFGQQAVCRFAFPAHFQPHFRQQFGVLDFRPFQYKFHTVILGFPIHLRTVM